MIKYKRFKRWVFAAKVKVPPKATPKDKDRAEQCGGSLTKASQQHVAINMLGTPITPKSLSLFLRCMSAHANPIPIQNPAQHVRVLYAPLPSIRVHGEVPSLSTSISSIPHGRFLLFCYGWYLIQHRKMRISSDGSPSTNHLKRPRDENEDIATEMSQTQEDSQGSFCPFTHCACHPFLIPSTTFSSHFLAAFHALPARTDEQPFSHVVLPYSQTFTRAPVSPIDEASPSQRRARPRACIEASPSHFAVQARTQC